MPQTPPVPPAGRVLLDGIPAAAPGDAARSAVDGSMIENLECRSVQVHRYNNACAYPEGSDLTLRRVYIDSSEQGLLTGAEPGCVRIPDSIFENLGMGGQTHATHLDGEELEIDGSYTPSSKSEAHCVKTRADRTYVSNSVIASIEIPRVAKQA